MTTLNDCTLLELPTITMQEGKITVVEGDVNVPFPIERVFYLYDVPGGSDRGGHSHRTLEQFVVCVMGSVSVRVDDGTRQREVELSRGYRGLRIPPLIWAHEFNFSTGGICLVLVSALFDERDYIRDYDEFLRLRAALASQGR
jgi:hypothetical protein